MARFIPGYHGTKLKYANGESYTITGSGFGTKPNGEKTLLSYENGALHARSRKTSLDSTLNGTQDASVLPGGVYTTALRWNHNASSDNIFSRIDYTGANSAAMYVFKKTYDDYNQTEITVTSFDLTGDISSVSVGHWAEGDTSTAEGEVIAKSGQRIYLYRTSGQKATSFTNGETINIYTDSGKLTSVGSFAMSGNVLVTHNNKIFRNWASGTNHPNYIFAGEGNENENIDRFTLENLSSSIFCGTWSGGCYSQEANSQQWKSMEHLFRESSTSTASDAVSQFIVDRTTYFNRSNLQARSAAQPNPHATFYLDQTSNTPNVTDSRVAANQYLARVYFDDGWSRVLLINGTDVEPQFIDAWSDTTIDIEFFQGSLPSIAGSTLEVYDSTNTLVHSQVL